MGNTDFSTPDGKHYGIISKANTGNGLATSALWTVPIDGTSWRGCWTESRYFSNEMCTDWM